MGDIFRWLPLPPRCLDIYFMMAAESMEPSQSDRTSRPWREGMRTVWLLIINASLLPDQGRLFEAVGGKAFNAFRCPFVRIVLV